MSKHSRRNKRFEKNSDNIVVDVGVSVQKKDRSPVVHQRTKLKKPLTIFQREFTQRQKDFISIATDKNTKMMLVSGPAGTGKTYLATWVGLMIMNEKKVSDLIYIRSAVESADSKLGYLPGESEEKMAPYLEPLREKLEELLPRNDIQLLESENRINAIPVGYLRGLNWNVKYIIADEMQNCTTKEIITLMTRVGEFSKIMILGDPMQSDINSKSGFKKIFDAFNDEESKKNGIHTFEFTEQDIVRSELVRFIVEKIKKLV